MQTGHSAQHPEEEWIQQFVGILFSFTCHTGPKKKKKPKNIQEHGKIMNLTPLHMSFICTRKNAEVFRGKRLNKMVITTLKSPKNRLLK
jgi:hypothetical protein